MCLSKSGPSRRPSASARNPGVCKGHLAKPQSPPSGFPRREDPLEAEYDLGVFAPRPHVPPAEQWSTPRLTALTTGADAQGKLVMFEMEFTGSYGEMFGPS